MDRAESPPAHHVRATLQAPVGDARTTQEVLVQVDHVRADRLVLRRPDHDRVVPHSNVQKARLDLLPVANVDRAAEGRPISNLAVSSTCREIVTSVGAVRSLIAGSSNPVVRGPADLARAIGSPNDAIAFRTGDRSRSIIEENGSTTVETLCAIKPGISVTSFQTNGESVTRTRPTTDGNTRPDTRRITGGVVAPGRA